MECKFDKNRNKDEKTVRLDGQEIQKYEGFRNLGSKIHKDGEFEKNLNHRIRETWMKRRTASALLCDL